ncbi:DUF3168 domain-containing protein [Cohaesibacter celericrescens]|jgi:hypothetical protein|uniref:DUF3168 domain-containing protein n=1 Tax=Cohaesibacter celericrescens TaxID=2067669 RepID=A0A2N5XRA4_9HYPH|nr:DUF3168 domain-containing protein [Cohaesibacter celericrescens]PLW76958.1 DUF3168 domain-containing protein [Cohaesibacter celericrescens]
MMLASRSLEQAIFNALKADNTLIEFLGGVRIYDEPRRDSVFPYLTVTTSYTRDWSTGSEAGDEHRLMITVWAGSNDRMLQQEILACLRASLTDPALSLTDHHLVNLQIERCEIRPDRKNRLLQGVMQIRAVTEEYAQ